MLSRSDGSPRRRAADRGLTVAEAAAASHMMSSDADVIEDQQGRAAAPSWLSAPPWFPTGLTIVGLS